MEQTKKSKTERLVTSSIFIALAVVLSFIKVYNLPLGGSITLLSMLPICLISLKYGVKWGLMCSFLYGAIQLGVGLGEIMGWGLDARMWVGCIVFDYLLAFGILGLSGVFRNKGKILMLTGVGISLALRFLCHFISGAIFFDIWMPEQFSNPYFYSLVYNGSYMLPETIFTLIGAGIIFSVPVIRNMMKEQ